MVMMLVQVHTQKTPCPSQKIIMDIRRGHQVGIEIKEESHLDHPVINLQELLQCLKDPNESQRSGHLTDLVLFIGYGKNFIAKLTSRTILKFFIFFYSPSIQEFEANPNIFTVICNQLTLCGMMKK